MKLQKRTFDQSFAEWKSRSFILSLTAMAALLPVTVFAAPVAKMKLLTSPQTVVLGKCSGTVSVQSQDTSGNAANVATNTKIFFDQGSAALGIFKDANCTVAISTVTMLAGTRQVSFYFKGKSLGSKLLYVSTLNYQDDSQTEKITSAPSTTPDPVPSPDPTPTPTPPVGQTPGSPSLYGRPVPSPIYGVTIDDVTNYPNQVAALQKFPYVPTARVVLDPGTAPSYYAPAIDAMNKSAYVMAELQDSADMKKQTVASYQSRAQSFFAALKNSVDIWEVGNEINGDWLGTGVEDKLRAGFKVLDDAGATTAITFFWFGEAGEANNCIPNPKNEMFTWISNLQQLSLPPTQRDPQNEKMRLDVDYVFISWYPQQCNDIKPNWPSIFSRLAAIYPNAKIGFGEVGTASPQQGSAYELNLLQEFYPMGSRVQLPSSYVGGYFWWYFSEELNNASIMNTLMNSILMGPKP